MKKIFFKIAGLFIGVVIAVLFLELFLRIAPKFACNYNYYRFKTEASDMEAFTIKDNRCRQPSALLGYEHIPSCDRNEDINSYGLIGKEHKLKKDIGTYRILLLGDSIAEEGWSADSLESSLNANPQLNSKYKFEIWNSGVGSYDVRRYYLYLKHKGLNYNPDMVMIFFCLNDFDLNINIYYKTNDGAVAYYFPLKAISKKYIVSPFLMRHSYLYRFIVLHLDSYLLNKDRRPGVDEQEEDVRYYLGMIKDIFAEKKIPLLAVIFPYLKPLSEYNDYQYRGYRNILRVVNGLEIDHINLYEYLRDKDLYGLRQRKEDEIHPHRQGHRMIAEIIYDYLLNKSKF